MITDTIPSLAIDWTDVTDSITVFLSSTVVIGGIAAVLAIRFVPGFMRAVRGIIRG